ncbi:MAG: U32 family peptidase [Trueperaceae bacterium]|nr:U32 family peptidase [Trueperaceae bacterium]
MAKQKKPELMSPAGYWPQLHAAVEAGADAVYFGLKHFTARAKVGFALAELPDVMMHLHGRGVKGFVTFNTLVFDSELVEAERALTAIAEAGADAIIVQDIGIAQMAKQIAPGLELHGSTQMSITSSQGAELARSFGCDRVVLGRELSLKDIERIASETDLSLEVFVHGALCVSYSGQCFSSEAWGGRSANRGQCAQACRLSYDLIVDGLKKELLDERYLLSPGDLYALEQIPELVRIGIDCFKIEGRYKDSEYVALTTAAYRKAIDEACAGKTTRPGQQEKQTLEQVYSRGLGDYFISGTNHQTVVRGRAPRHRGLKVAEVTKVSHNAVEVRTLYPLKRGDGLVFDAAHRRSPEEKEEGGAIYNVKPLGKDSIRLEFANKSIDFSRIRAGDWVWRTADADIGKLAKPYLDNSQPLYTRPISFTVMAKMGESLRISAETEDGLKASVQGTHLLEPAQKRALDETQLQAQLGRLGGTPFHLETLRFDCDEALFVPVSELNDLRRQVIDKLLELRKYLPERPTFAVIKEKLSKLSQQKEVQSFAPKLHVLVRTPGQLDTALETRPDSITLDYLELYGLKPSVEKVKEAGIAVRVASPRILKPSEQNIIRFLQSLEAEILVRSGGLLHDFQNLDVGKCPPLSGDFSLNAANALSCESFLAMGLTRLTPTHDLNAEQIIELSRYCDPERLEVITYQHLPVFHTEHCVFCRFLSEGSDYTNCGHPCEQHRVALKDKQGRLHPVMADVGCRNTVFGAEAQTGVTYLEDWLNAGIVNYRLEFVHEDAKQVKTVIRAFQDAFNGKLSFKDLAEKLKVAAPEGITEGSFYVPDDHVKLLPML